MKITIHHKCDHIYVENNTPVDKQAVIDQLKQAVEYIEKSPHEKMFSNVVTRFHMIYTELAPPMSDEEFKQKSEAFRKWINEIAPDEEEPHAST
jgi:predicted DNA-binding protein YlxM (UPF0122 family)